MKQTDLNVISNSVFDGVSGGMMETNSIVMPGSLSRYLHPVNSYIGIEKVSNGFIITLNDTKTVANTLEEVFNCLSTIFIDKK